MNTLQTFKQWVKTQNHPLARAIRLSHQRSRHFEIPALRCLYLPLRLLHASVNQLWSTLTRVLYWTPMFKTRLSRSTDYPGDRLNLFCGMPQVLGALNVKVGSDCRISGQTTFSGRWSSRETPLLQIGNNVGISWQTTIAVGSKVILKDNVRMGGRVFLAGYPGHPIDPVQRAKGLPDKDDQVGDIILEEDVWLGSGVTVTRGVTIGRGTIVAAGSIVTHDLPSYVIAAGYPAKVVRKLDHYNFERVTGFYAHSNKQSGHNSSVTDTQAPSDKDCHDITENAQFESESSSPSSVSRRKLH